VTGLTVFQAAGEGDPTACELFDRLGFWLGVGIASLTSIVDLDVVGLGGGLVAAGDLLLRPARASLERFAFAPTYRELPPVVPARLGSAAGMIGAANLALRQGADEIQVS
jgi:glucokinase